jgi:RHS repeat-associated protein
MRTTQAFFDQLDRPYTNLIQVPTTGGFSWSARKADFDARGRVMASYNPWFWGGSGTGYWALSYDALDRVTAEQLYTAAGALDRQITHAFNGLAVTTTDPKSNQTTRHASAWGDLARVTDAAAGNTNYQFEAFGLLTQVSDVYGNIVDSIGYNVRGMKTSATNIDRGTWTYLPNALGEVEKIRDAKTSAPNWTTQTTFDALGRPTQRVEAEGTSTWTWGTLADNTANNKYVGRLKSMAGPGYSESYVFDNLGRPKTTTYSADTSYQVDYAYGATTGLLDSVTYPTSTASYRLKAQYLYQYGVLTQVRDFNVPATVWWQLNTVDERGNPIDEQLANGVHVLANYDGLTGHLNWRTSGTAAGYSNQQNLSYQWDKNENLTDRIDVNQSNQTEHFQHDALNRLDTATLNGQLNLDVNVDAIGNITWRCDVGTYTYHASKKHQVVSTSGVAASPPCAPNGSPAWAFSYDNNGNMLTGRGTTFTWMSYNLPATVTNGTLTAQFSYTPDRRYWKQVAHYASWTETTIYVGGLLEKMTRGSTTDYRHYISAGSATIVVSRSTGTNNNTYYLTQDHLGSSNVLTDSAGALLVNESFAAYGQRRSPQWQSQSSPSSGDLTKIRDSSRRGFTQHSMLDNLSLIHMNGRMYDPMIGRFLSADPFVPAPDDGQSFNRYSYVRNNPLAATDPSGFIKEPAAKWICISGCGSIGTAPISDTVAQQLFANGQATTAPGFGADFWAGNSSSSSSTSAPSSSPMGWSSTGTMDRFVGRSDGGSGGNGGREQSANSIGSAANLTQTKCVRQTFADDVSRRKAAAQFNAETLKPLAAGVTLAESTGHLSAELVKAARFKGNEFMYYTPSGQLRWMDLSVTRNGGILRQAARAQEIVGDLKVFSTALSDVSVGFSAYGMLDSYATKDYPSVALNAADLSMGLAALLFPPAVPVAIGYGLGRVGGELVIMANDEPVIARSSGCN